jgi:hypothetical protein
VVCRIKSIVPKVLQQKSEVIRGAFNSGKFNIPDAALFRCRRTGNEPGPVPRTEFNRYESVFGLDHGLKSAFPFRRIKIMRLGFSTWVVKNGAIVLFGIGVV